MNFLVAKRILSGAARPERGPPRAKPDSVSARLGAQSAWRSFTSRSSRSPLRPRTSWASCTVTFAQTTCSSRPLGAWRGSGARCAHRCCRHLRLADFGLCTPAADPTQPRQRATQPVTPLRVLCPLSCNSAGRNRSWARQTTSPRRSSESDPRSVRARWAAIASVHSVRPLLPAICAAAECDWWSFGVIAFECLCGYTPFYADDPKEEIRRIKNWEQHLVGGDAAVVRGAQRCAQRFPAEPQLSDHARDLIVKLGQLARPDGRAWINRSPRQLQSRTRRAGFRSRASGGTPSLRACRGRRSLRSSRLTSRGFVGALAQPGSRHIGSSASCAARQSARYAALRRPRGRAARSARLAARP
jgi:serine/threonine protein kinase